MKKFLIVLSILTFLLIAGPVQADWVEDLVIPNNTTHLNVKFSGVTKKGLVVVKTSSTCIKYKIVDNEIVKTKKCEDIDWENFSKK